MSAILSTLGTVGTYLGLWSMASVAVTLCLIPWFRALGRRHADEARRDRRAAWQAAAVQEAPGEPA